MNEWHLTFCASPEWRDMVENQVLPVVLRDVDLGDDLLEIGPGPGLTTDVLRRRVDHLTAVEFDADLARALAERLSGTNVEVVEGDATALDFADSRFSAAASFHMLHHVEGDDRQDAVFGELARVLRPRGVLVAADGVEDEGTRAFHAEDVYNPIDPDGLADRLRRAGFDEVTVGRHDLGWYCAARTPAAS